MGDPTDEKIHAYTLAKDEEHPYRGPAWVPFNLWTQYEYGADGTLNRVCAEKLIFSPGAERLWQAIAARYNRPDNMAASLPRRCAEFLAHWGATPKETPAQFKRNRKELARKAESLAIALERFFLHRDPPDDPGFGHINFTQLLTEAELEMMDHRLARHNVDGAYELFLTDDRGQPGIVPDLPDMMRRIAKLFEEDAIAPPLQRPRGRNAKRNYFVRCLIRFFLHEWADVSPSIVASIASIFFAAGITDNEVSKQIDYLPDGRKMPYGGVKLPA